MTCLLSGSQCFPSQIESVLLMVEGVEPHYYIEVDRVGSLDQITVVVEINEAIFSDEIKALEAMEKNLEEK